MKEKDFSKIIYDAVSITKKYKFKTIDDRKVKARNENKNFNELQFKNKLRSSIFVEAVAFELYKKYDKDHHLLNVIKIDKEKETRIKGEFMLDIVISKSGSIGPYQYNSQFIWAIESEAQYATSEFIKDFPKLINVKSENYLYLNGLISKNSTSKENDIRRRLGEALIILKKSNISNKDCNFYISFFPYPGKSKGSISETLLNETDIPPRENVNPNEGSISETKLDDRNVGKFAHLGPIETYKYDGSRFELISIYP